MKSTQMNKTRETKASTWLVVMAGIWALGMLAFAIAGGIRNFSSVPFMDMYDGTVGFYNEIKNGNLAAWWGQHNEHRLVLSRVLFLIDGAVFGGQNQFLFVMNYVLLALSAGVFVKFISKLSPTNNDRNWVIASAFFIAGWTFLWAQKVNILWAFQSQFILAQLVPLSAFYLLMRSTQKDSTKTFVGACLLGVLSALSMANGILALPLMAMCSLLMVASMRRRIVLWVLAIIVPAVYLYGFTSPGHGSSSLETALTMPFGVLLYMLYYLGSPFYIVLTELGMPDVASRVCAAVMSSGLIIFSAVTLVRQILNKDRNPLILALLFYILYVGGTALITSSGRLSFGMDLAFTSRYTTPSVFAFSALVILTAHFAWSSRSAVPRTVMAVFLICLSATLLVFQRQAIDRDSNKLFVQDVGALALSLQIPDENYIRNVFPYKDYALKVVRESAEMGSGFYGSGPYKDALARLDQTTNYDPTALRDCKGYLDRIGPISGVNDFRYVEGWMYDEQSDKGTKWLTLVNDKSEIKGYAMRGESRADVATEYQKPYLEVGFVGYVRTESVYEPLYAVDEAQNCKLTLPTHQGFLRYRYEGPDAASDADVYADTSMIIAGDVWAGRDYYKSSFPGFEVLGSFQTSDADTGRITLRLERGMRLYVRTGPSTNSQFVTLKEDGRKMTLPVNEEWVSVGFNLGDEGPESFEVEISDDGTEWGEWSAIALKTAGD